MSEATQQRLQAEVATELGVEEDAVLLDAQRRAQRLVAHALTEDDARDSADLAGRVQAATALFRGGELALARQQASAVLEQLRRAPHLPGAARLAWQTHVLFGRIAWTSGDTEQAENALRRAVVLDPGASLSTRRVPPDLAALYRMQREAVLADRDNWKRPELGVDLDGAQVELDGRIGMRPLPPGEHFVVVRWLGAPAAAAMLRPNAKPELTRPATKIASGLPIRGPQAQRICDELELGQLVLARTRGGRLGMQVYRCGEGFGTVYYSDETIRDDAVWDGVAIAVGGDAFKGKRSPLLDRTPWPKSSPDSIEPATGPIDGGPTDTTKKPWYKRAWIWVVVGAVVVGAVTTGAVLGTRKPNRVIEANIEEWTG